MPLRPVSYTHLDVYKRQEHIHLSFRGMLVYFVSLVDKIVGGVALSGNHNYYVVALTVRTVSYTHLDVYKRQSAHGYGR